MSESTTIQPELSCSRLPQTLETWNPGFNIGSHNKKTCCRSQPITFVFELGVSRKRSNLQTQSPRKTSATVKNCTPVAMDAQQGSVWKIQFSKPRRTFKPKIQNFHIGSSFKRKTVIARPNDNLQFELNHSGKPWGCTVRIQHLI